MDTLLLYDPRFLAHDPGEGHPESPQRLAAILEALEAEPLPGVRLTAPRRATEAELTSVHTGRLVAEVLALAGRSAQLDPDTATSPGSVEAALLAAGAAAQAAEALMAGTARTAFALVRPPGHHAEPDRAMGFCLFNNAAIAAEAALRRGARRVLIHDFDVHHGNGTQAAFLQRAEVLYQSIHQFPYYPGSGTAEEVGEGPGRGFTVNVPIPPGCGDVEYGVAFERLFLPIARAYRPDLLIVSAGFDAHRADPLGGMELTARGYAAMCSALAGLADEVCGGRVLVLLEGGYSSVGLSRSVRACLEILQGRREPFPVGPGERILDAVARSADALRPYWRGL